MQRHWTDRNQANGNDMVVGESQRIRQRDRNRLSQLSNQVLKCYLLRLEDWSGSKFILRDLKGSSVIVNDLGELWPAAENLVKKKLDPLDPQFIQTLYSVNGGTTI
ncbi:MAG: hypothetical protein WD907_06190 [Bacilli bacterium]